MRACKKKIPVGRRFGLIFNHDSAGNMRVVETTISRLADGTAVRQTIAAPKENADSASQSGPRVRLPSGLPRYAHSGARLQRLVHGAFAACSGLEP